MALLSQVMRTAAITGRADASNTWFGAIATRQGGRWAQQTVQAAIPGRPPRPAANPESEMRDLAELQRRGVLTDAEAEALRARIGS